MSRDGLKLTQAEKEQLTDTIANLAIRDVLNKEDLVKILTVCREACDREMEKISWSLKGSDTMQ